MTPIFSSACDLAHSVPELVADFLELEIGVKRRFREDGVTDMLIACLLTLPGHNVVVQTPIEKTTGADLDIAIVEPSSRDIIQYRIQAKRLHPHRFNWDYGLYKELSHPNNTGEQAATLIRSARRDRIPTIPLFMFYNPRSTCFASSNEVSGISLADGEQIAAIIRAGVRAKPKRPPYQRLRTLKGLFFPLSTILCPETSESGSIVSPGASREAVERAVRERSDGPLYLPAVEIPRIGYEPAKARPEFPSTIQQAIGAREGQRVIRSRVRRPRVVLIAD